MLSQTEEPDKGLTLIESSIKESQEGDFSLLTIDGLTTKADIYLGLGKLNECLEAIEESEKLLETIEIGSETEKKDKLASINHVKGSMYRRKGDTALALEHLENALSTRKELQNNYSIADSLNVIGTVHARKGDFDNALKNLQESLDIYEELGAQRPLLRLFNNIGIIQYYKGELDLALDYSQRSLELSEQFGNRQSAAALLLNMGNIYMDKGELDQALDYYQKSLTNYEELKSQYEIAICLNNIGTINEIKAELDQALEDYSRSLAIFEEQENKLMIATSYSNMGSIFQVKGDTDEASTYYMKGLELLEETGNDLEASVTLFSLIKIAVQNNSIEEANSYLQKLQNINEKTDNKVIDQTYRLSNATILKSSDRVVKRAEAQELFQEIAEEDIIQHENTVDAMLNQCEMLLQELKTTGDEEVLGEINTILQKLLTIAENQHAYSLMANSHLLKSKIALLELDLNSARQLISQAQQIADDKGLNRLAVMISGEYDLLLGQLSKWTEFIDSNVSMIERIELAELEGMVSRIVSKKTEVLEIPDEEPVLFLILSKAGTNLYSKQFVSEKTLDDQVLAGLLAAINSFIQETFSATGSIERVKHKENTIILNPIDPVLCCYVFKGQSYNAVHKLDKFVKSVQESKSVHEILTSVKDSDVAFSDVKPIEALAKEAFL
ncbi:MAG: tetratricopeptide repeat protein [Candidatus Hodarchaeales archaeon]